MDISGYSCEKCKAKRDAVKRCTIVEAPAVLILQIVRATLHPLPPTVVVSMFLCAGLECTCT